MSIVRKSLPLLILAAIPVLVVVATESTSVPSVRPPPRMSAVDLANGVLFGQGPAAPYLRDVEPPDQRLTSKMISVERSVDEALRMSPSLARASASDLQSGNPLRVSEALVSLWGLVQPAYNREFGTRIPRIDVAAAKAALGRYSAIATETAVNCPTGSGSGSGSGSGTSGNQGAALALKKCRRCGFSICVSFQKNANVIFSENVVFRNFLGLYNRKSPFKADNLSAFQTVDLIALNLDAT